MERSSATDRTGWKYFLVLFACALTACDKAELPFSEDISSDDSAALGLIENFQPNANGNTTPSITGKPAQQAPLGANYFFKPIANDPDGDRLGFSIRNKPAWASFDPNSGELSGIPVLEDSGLVAGIVISVSDGSNGSALPPFSIKITATGAPPPPNPGESSPQIGGSPAALAAFNQLYYFQPFASDLDGDELEFAIVNKPPWLSFDSVSGTVSGIPAATDVGSYSGIWISVSDGLNMAGIGPFTIEVVAIGQNSINLSWLPPTENDDGSPLVDLAGYRIRYGVQANSHPNLIDINNPGIVTYGVDSLVPDTYYFVITAYNSSGVESESSNEATITLN